MATREPTSSESGAYLGRRLGGLIQPHCTECGSVERPIKRIEADERFCTNCYERLYVRKACLRCASVARIHKSLTRGLCRSCTLGPRSCQRCEKPFKRAGRIVNERWVCPSCAHYFLSPEPCEQCGTLSTRLARSTKSGVAGRLCPKCQRTHHSTCARCRRHRVVHRARRQRILRRLRW